MKLFLAVVFSILPVLSFAKVSYDKDTSTLQISGPTNMAQVVSASNFLREEEVDYVIMWGPGGSLEMAIQLGKHIRKEDLVVVVPPDKSCISACAFAALGANEIRIDGKFLVHRPYIPGVPVMWRMEDALAHMGRGYLMLAYYLEDMGYDRSLMENIMKFTSPCKFMVYKDVTVTGPENLWRWSSDDSRCQLLNMNLGR